MRSILILIVLCLSCNSCGIKSNFVLTLTFPHSCWLMYANPEKDLKNDNLLIFACTKFNENRTFDSYFVEKKIQDKILPIDGGGNSIGQWEFVETENKLVINSQTFKIEYFNPDTIVLKNEESNKVQFMINCNPVAKSQN